MKIVADQHIPFLDFYLKQATEIILKPGRAINAQDVKNADILLVRSITKVNADLLQASSVKFVGSITAGADHLDAHYLDQAGITWVTATGFNAPPVADYVVSVIAALQTQGLLNKPKLCAAVIGVGHVGRLVTDYLQKLNFNVIQCDPLRAANEPDFNSISLEEIANVDLITVHVPLTKGGVHPTYHFLEQTFLQKQTPGTIIINTSRGGIIDTEILLNAGQHLRWCLDVYEHEPHMDARLLTHTFITTPHIAGYSVQSKRRGIQQIVKALVQSGLYPELSVELPPLPKQQLSFNGAALTWQTIALGVFNPMLMTILLQNKLKNPVNAAEEFDHLRNDFNYRHEFAYTDICDTQLANEDRQILEQLGFKIRM